MDLSRLSVCSVRAHNSKTKRHRKTEIGVPHGRSNWCASSQFKNLGLLLGLLHAIVGGQLHNVDTVLTCVFVVLHFFPFSRM